MAEATRAAFGRALVRVGGTEDRIVVLDADLASSTCTKPFADKYPERFFEVGIAEGNMVGVAAGLALAGKIPFAASFACFLAGRFEQIRVSVAYNRANVKLVGTHAGIGIGEDGYSQMGLEDVALMRTLPNLVVVQPADGVEAEAAVEHLVQHEGPAYLRLTRQKVADVSPAGYRFEFGRAVVLREGRHLAIAASGAVVGHALVAAYSPHADPVHKISIVPRGRAALGYTMQLPAEDQFLLTRSELLDRIRGMLGGRAAEEIVFDEVSTGAQNDLERATALARQMVALYGMSERVGLANCAQRQPTFLAGPEFQLQRDCSEQTAREIDEEVKKLLDRCYAEAKEVLSLHRDQHEQITAELFRHETIDGPRFYQLIGREIPRPKELVPTLEVAVATAPNITECKL